MKKEQIEKIVLQYIDKIKKNGIPVSHVFIFGSTVKGNAHGGSDIDTCIISPLFGRNRQKERLLLMNLRDGISDLIEPHPYSEKDFRSPYDPLSYQIKQTGIKIF